MEEQPIDPGLLDDLRARSVDGRRVAVSAMVAGVAFLLVELVGHALAPASHALVTPVRIASLLLDGDMARSSESPAGLVVLALVLHGILSLVYTLILCLAIRRLPLVTALVGGVLFGLALYVVNHHAMTPFASQLREARGPIAVAAHVAFGLVAVVVFTQMKNGRDAGARSLDAVDGLPDQGRDEEAAPEPAPPPGGRRPGPSAG